MSVILFKEGKSVKINGISCDKVICSPYEVHDKIAEGWKLSVEDLYTNINKPTIDIVGKGFSFIDTVVNEHDNKEDSVEVVSENNGVESGFKNKKRGRKKKVVYDS